MQSFFIDLDCQYLMVPKQLVHQVLTYRLLNTLKRLMHYITPFIREPINDEEEKEG